MPALLAACPELKICANMFVGYNNFDLEAMTAAGVLGTNAPDVLTETTADFGFPRLMATARRITESEHFLRSGEWTRWRRRCAKGVLQRPDWVFLRASLPYTPICWRFKMWC